MIADSDPYEIAGTPVLVTGGGGFIGSHLVEALLAAGAEVTVLDNGQAGGPANLAAVEDRIRWIEGDVRDAGRVESVLRDTQPRTVYHLAANASVPGSVEDPVYDFETNSGGTFNLLNALRLWGGCERIVLASSGAVYGQPDTFPIRETHALRPISPYGASKLGAETSALVFHRIYALPVTTARIFNVYGPRMERFVILDFLRKLRQNPRELEILGDGQQVRDFNYISDAIGALLLLGCRGAPGEAYNISSGVSYSVTELAGMILAALGLERTTRISYTGRSWVGDAQHWEVSIDKLAQLGYAPRVRLPEGLERVIAWFNGLAAPRDESGACRAPAGVAQG